MGVVKSLNFHSLSNLELYSRFDDRHMSVMMSGKIK
jgi:hypothetical protein